MGAAGRRSMRWFAWICSTAIRGLCSSTSKFSCIHPAPFSLATARTKQSVFHFEWLGPGNRDGRGSATFLERRNQQMVHFGVIGYGYWGPNIVRNIRGLEGAKLMAVCDTNKAAADRARKANPDVHVTTDPAE